MQEPRYIYRIILLFLKWYILKSAFLLSSHINGTHFLTCCPFSNLFCLIFPWLPASSTLSFHFLLLHSQPTSALAFSPYNRYIQAVLNLYSDNLLGPIIGGGERRHTHLLWKSFPNMGDEEAPYTCSRTQSSLLIHLIQGLESNTENRFWV